MKPYSTENDFRLNTPSASVNQAQSRLFVAQNQRGSMHNFQTMDNHLNTPISEIKCNETTYNIC
jgi:hypothetical protein